MTHHIEDKEIRGITGRTIKWIIVSTVTIVMSIMVNWFAIESSIKDLGNDNLLQDLKIKTLKIRMDKIEAQINQIQINQQKTFIEIEQLKAKEKKQK